MEPKWAAAGGTAGLVALAGYFAVLFVPAPGAAKRLIFFAIPLAGLVFVLGLGNLLKKRSDGVLREIAVVFGVIGFAVMNVMAVVQLSIHIWMNQGQPASADAAVQEMAAWVRRSVNAVHLGLGVSFDIFVLSSIGLFAALMIRNPRFGLVLGASGLAIAAAMLILNLWAFPVPPEPDLGPLAGLWLGAVAVRMLAMARRA